MKITNIQLPEMVNYYDKSLDMQSIAEKFAESYARVLEDKLSISMTYDHTIYTVLKFIKEKTEPITIGNGKLRAYEYELGYTGNNGHIFLLVADGRDYYCTLDSLHNTENGDLYIEFQII